MSDNTSNTQNANQDQQQGKGAEPSHDMYIVKGQGKNSQWYKVGAVWPGKDDSYSGETLNGRVVLKSRLKELREQKQAEGNEQTQEQKQGQDPSM